MSFHVPQAFASEVRRVRTVAHAHEATLVREEAQRHAKRLQRKAPLLAALARRAAQLEARA